MSTTMSSSTASVIAATPTPKRPKARHSPYSKLNPILLSSDRQSRKRKSITWQPDEKIHTVHYFEYIADERINVTRMNNADQQIDPNASAATGSSLNNKTPNAGGSKISNASVDAVRRSYGKSESDKCIEYLSWRPLVLIDFTSELPLPGWNSLERSAQAERETYVLGAIDLPGQPSTLDEPDQQTKAGASAVSSSGSSTTSSSSSGSASNNGGSGASASDAINKDGSTSSIRIIPLDNADGMYTEYPDMYNSDYVNGVKLPSNNPQPVVQPMIPTFCNQQSQLIPNQFQQQLVHATQNPFTFQDMGAQFHHHQQQQQPHQPQQAQMQIQFPFQHQQQPVQQPMMPFANQQQQLQVQSQQQQPAPFVNQQSALTGPVMPWLSYPFNQVNENSHAHLFRRPAT